MNSKVRKQNQVMANSTGNESEIVIHDLSPLLRVYKDGRIERLEDATPIPASMDPKTGVESKDITIFPETGVCARLFKPTLVHKTQQKIPLVVYFHGGGFCIQSTFSALNHNYLNNLASQAQVLIVSIEYRLAPEHPLPVAYDDSWDALNWIISHTTGTSFSSSMGAEPWLLEYADFSRIFLAGDSSGANIVHHMALRVGKQGLANDSINHIHINGLILGHPHFWGKTRIGDEVIKLASLPNPNTIDKAWELVCPTGGLDSPWIDPAHDPSLSGLGCDRVLIFVAEKDVLRDRGVYYKEVLEKSGWQGKVEVVESLREGHVFHVFNPCSTNAVDLMKKVAEFISQEAAQQYSDN